MGVIQEIGTSMQQGRAPKVKEYVQAALNEGIQPKEILEDGLLATMAAIGERFKKNEIFVPEVLIAARAMNAGMEVLGPHLVSAGIEEKGTVVIGTIKGDLHDIGKNLVKMMMEGKGLRVVDLGVNVAPEQFLSAAQENSARIIACSALLTTTMNEMKRVVELVKTSGLQERVKVMVGGAPITQSFCDAIGADCYAPDAASAADAALSLL